MNLTTQKKLAAKILKVGVNRVWIDPEHMEEVSRAITRNSIRALINDGVIKAKPVNGISSYRAKHNAEQKKKEEDEAMVVSKGLKELELLRKKHG